MFKKLVFAFLVLFMCINISFAEEDGVCGKTFMYAYNHELYILKFNMSAIGPDCNGTMVFYWSNQSKEYYFYTEDLVFITVTNFGEFVLKDGKLKYLDPDGFTFEEM